MEGKGVGGQTKGEEGFRGKRREGNYRVDRGNDRSSRERGKRREGGNIRKGGIPSDYIMRGEKIRKGRGGVRRERGRIWREWGGIRRKRGYTQGLFPSLWSWENRGARKGVGGSGR